MAQEFRDGDIVNPISRSGPLSHVQYWQWLTETMQGYGRFPPKRVVTFHFMRTGDFDVKRLEESLAALAQRHEVLRTSFRESDDDVIQAVVNDVMVPVELEEIPEITPEVVSAKLSAIDDEHLNRKFDLAKGPLRLQVLRGLEEFCVFISLHHIAVDFQSIELLLREFQQLYASPDSSQVVSQLPPVGWQPVDYAVWEKTQEDASERNLNHWVELLRDAPANPAFSNDRGLDRMDEPGYAIELEISHENIQLLQEASTRFRATPATLLTSAFVAACARRTWQDEFVINMIGDTRDRPEIKNMVACCVFPVFMRIQLDEAVSLRSLVNKIKREMVTALSRARYSYVDLVQAMELRAIALGVRPYWTRGLYVNMRVPGVTDSPPQKPSGGSFLHIHSIQKWERIGSLKGVTQLGFEVFPAGEGANGLLLVPGSLVGSEPEALAKDVGQYLGELAGTPFMEEHVRAPIPRGQPGQKWVRTSSGVWAHMGLIESVIRSHPQVTDVSVIAGSPNSDGNVELTARVVASDERVDELSVIDYIRAESIYYWTGVCVPHHVQLQGSGSDSENLSIDSDKLREAASPKESKREPAQAGIAEPKHILLSTVQERLGGEVDGVNNFLQMGGHLRDIPDLLGDLAQKGLTLTDPWALTSTSLNYVAAKHLRDVPFE
jgi:hypothetical protein